MGNFDRLLASLEGFSDALRPLAEVIDREGIQSRRIVWIDPPLRDRRVARRIARDYGERFRRLPNGVYVFTGRPLRRRRSLRESLQTY